MRSSDLREFKGKRATNTFALLPHTVVRARENKSPPSAVLSKTALALLVDICQQFNGSNNGNLAAAPKTLEPYGWKSRGTLYTALVELIALGFLVQTRQGGRNRNSLYAVTWHGIDQRPHDAKPDPVP